MTRVILKKGKAKPLWHGHPWVMSAAIAKVEGAPDDGDVVQVFDAEGRSIGQGHFSGGSQIRVRMLAGPKEKLDRSLIRRRLEAALALRRDFLGLPSQDTNGYRLVHAEGDRLPGLIVDVFGDCLTVQFLAIGMKRMEREILDALEKLLSPRCIVEVSGGAAQRHEGISSHTGVVRGEAPEGPWTIREAGLEMVCDALSGQKTGFYFDQRDNRAAVAALSPGRRVLDAYSYSGAFACSAARAGASRVVAVDSSKPALRLASENVRRNGLDVEVVHEDVARYLRGQMEAGTRFDLVVLDPPKFAPRAAAMGDAQRAYRAVNAAALALVDDGILASASCSHHVGEAELGRALSQAAKDAGRSLQVLEVRTQAPDHPWLVACPESRYLTMFLCRVTRV